MGWERAIITDSGGFQVFSLAHGGVADEIKGRRGNAGGGAKVEISEEGVAFQSLLDGSNRFLGPEDSMRIQAALGSDIALTFDECTPAHADRDYTARLHGAHPPLARALPRLARAAGPGRARPSSASSRAGSTRTCAASRPKRPRLRRSTGSRSAAPSGVKRRRCTACSASPCRSCPVEAPRHLLGIGEVDDLLVGIEIGIDLFDCAIPTRLARHGVALAPEPEGRFRIDLDQGPLRRRRRSDRRGCPCEACRRHTRAYLHYLARQKDLTGTRLLTLHNLTYMQELVAGARRAIGRSAFARLRQRGAQGLNPWAGGVLDSAR